MHYVIYFPGKFAISPSLSSSILSLLNLYTLSTCFERKQQEEEKRKNNNKWKCDSLYHSRGCNLKERKTGSSYYKPNIRRAWLPVTFQLYKHFFSSSLFFLISNGWFVFSLYIWRFFFLLLTFFFLPSNIKKEEIFSYFYFLFTKSREENKEEVENQFDILFSLKISHLNVSVCVGCFLIEFPSLTMITAKIVKRGMERWKH